MIAANIEHAEEITEWLMDRGEDVCLVTSKAPNAHAKLQEVRESTQAWIVSVVMISEGVDIPRLRVCCYLSHIRTEQHFRQALGRIIRRMELHDPDCYLFVLNETLLRHYAHRIEDGLPDEKAIVTVVPTEQWPYDRGGGNTHLVETQHSVIYSTDDTALSTPDDASVVFGVSATTTASTAAKTRSQWEHDMAFSQRFIEHLATLEL